MNFLGPNQFPAPLAPAVANGISQAAAHAYSLFIVVLEPKRPEYDLEKIALEQKIRDQAREIERLKAENAKLDMRLYLRRAAANKTSIGIDLVFPEDKPK
jgi:hypothetical protein